MVSSKWREKIDLDIEKLESDIDGLEVEVKKWKKRVFVIARRLGSLLAKPDYGDLWRESVRKCWEDVREIRNEILERGKELGLGWEGLSKSWDDVSDIEGSDDIEGVKYMALFYSMRGQLGLSQKLVKIAPEMTKVLGYIEGVGDCAEGWIDEIKVFDDMKRAHDKKKALKEMEKGVRTVSDDGKNKYGEDVEVA